MDDGYSTVYKCDGRRAVSVQIDANYSGLAPKFAIQIHAGHGWTIAVIEASQAHEMATAILETYAQFVAECNQ
jgi:hypothetical protein